MWEDADAVEGACVCNGCFVADRLASLSFDVGFAGFEGNTFDLGSATWRVTTCLVSLMPR